MASVVFMRAVNVGGFQKFQPSAVAKRLVDLGVFNIGAAGTFVVKQNIDEVDLKKHMLHGLPFQPELMICSGEEILALINSKPFARAKLGRNVKGFVSVLRNPLPEPPDLPVDQPKGTWGVRVIAVTGRFAMSLWRKLEGESLVYPNAVVEKKFGVSATTRSWNTIVTVGKLLAPPSA